MSVAASTWAWRMISEGRVPQHRAKLVLLALADRADEDGHCWPSNTTLGDKTSQGLEAVRRGLNDLESAGLLVRKRRRMQNGHLAGWEFWLRVGDHPAPTRDGRDEPSRTWVGNHPAPVRDQEHTPVGDIHRSPSSSDSASPPKKGTAPRPRDEVWDAMTEAFGSPTTPSEKRHRGKIVSELKQGLIEEGVAEGRRGEEVRRRVRSLRSAWGAQRVTADSLAKHWTFAATLNYVGAGAIPVYDPARDGELT